MIRKIFIAVVLLFSNNSFGQAGYIGKMNEISWDAFSAAYTSKFEFTYKLSLWEHASIYANYGFCNSSHSFPITNYNLRVIDPSGNVTYVTENDISSADIKANVTTFGFGILYNSPSNNMQMPVGYYSGLGIHFTRGTNTDEYNLKSDLPAGYTTSVPYNLKENSIRIYIGKDIPLTPSVTLDLCLGAGFSWGSMTQSAAITQGIVENTPYSQFPLAVPLFQQRDFVNLYDYSTGTNIAKFNFYGLYLMPNVRIGYMF